MTTCANCGQPIIYIPEEGEWAHRDTYSLRCAIEFYAIPATEAGR